MGLVKMYCETCGKLAWAGTEEAQQTNASLSCFNLVECSKCRKNRLAKEAKEGKKRELENKKKERQFAAFLKRNKMTKRELIESLPDDMREYYLGED